MVKSNAEMFTSAFLSGVRRRAIRRGFWFSVLDHVERGILSLSARVVEKVESVVLGIELVKILKKLKDAMMSGFAKRMEDYGVERAKQIVAQAVSWGYETTRAWVSDRGFAEYLTLLDMYSPSGWGI